MKRSAVGQDGDGLSKGDGVDGWKKRQSMNTSCKRTATRFLTMLLSDLDYDEGACESKSIGHVTRTSPSLHSICLDSRLSTLPDFEYKPPSFLSIREIDSGHAQLHRYGG